MFAYIYSYLYPVKEPIQEELITPSYKLPENNSTDTLVIKCKKKKKKKKLKNTMPK